MRVRETNPLDIVFANFAQLEEQLIECLRLIPFTVQNANSISPKFVSILLEACSLIESIFRRMKHDQKRHNLRSYSKDLEPHLNLEKATTIFLASPIYYLRPFKDWTTTPPTWWTAYNQLKHDRVESYAAASYTSVVLAVAGLHQVIARSRLFVERLAKAGWVDPQHDHISDLNLCTYVGCQPPWMPAETQLFVSPLTDDFADWTTDPPKIDEDWGFTWRVKHHLWDDLEDQSHDSA